jgi:hypothetical protein
MYKQIKTPEDNIPEGVVGVWAVNSNIGSSQPQVLSDALLASPVVFGYLNSEKRAKLVKQLRDNRVYVVDFNNVDKNEKIGNKRVYSYSVTINMQSYMAVFKNYLTMIGQESIASQLGEPKASNTYKATISVDPYSRQTIRSIPQGVTRGEVFSNFDSNDFGKPPENIKMTVSQLQRKLTGQGN